MGDLLGREAPRECQRRRSKPVLELGHGGGRGGGEVPSQLVLHLHLVEGAAFGVEVPEHQWRGSSWSLLGWRCGGRGISGHGIGGSGIGGRRRGGGCRAAGISLHGRGGHGRWAA